MTDQLVLLGAAHLAYELDQVAGRVGERPNNRVVIGLLLACHTQGHHERHSGRGDADRPVRTEFELRKSHNGP